LEKHPDAKALLVINPTYFGICANLQEIVDLTHAYDIPVLVDEAHGAHIHFHETLPISAMQAGADMAATSIHKLGGSMTQSSILNVQGKRINPKRVQAVLSMLTTTSTSYLLLASLDAARRHLYMNGHAMATQAIELANEARVAFNDIPGLYCFGEEILGTEATYDYDPTKLTIHVRKLGVTGFVVEQMLRERFAIEVEMSDMYNILCIITSGDSKHSIHQLVHAMQTIANECAQVERVIEITVKNPQIPPLALTPRDAFYAKTESIALTEAEGRIIAEFVMVYPPGIPILLPGEVISKENIDYIVEHVQQGLPVQGPEDQTIQTIKVIVEEVAIFE
jgi:arginine decarboxylase